MASEMQEKKLGALRDKANFETTSPTKTDSSPTPGIPSRNLLSKVKLKNNAKASD
jgi:hypothetical protein